jgi:putative acyl-CoA dehydrogenase
VEEGILARHYRESPVNAIWEGSGNVMCLDVLRALTRERDAAEAVLADLAKSAGDLPEVKSALAQITTILRSAEAESRARHAVEQLAVLAATAAMRDHVPTGIADSFARSQLGARGSMFGAAMIEVPDKVLQRALPA